MRIVTIIRILAAALVVVAVAYTAGVAKQYIGGKPGASDQQSPEASKLLPPPVEKKPEVKRLIIDGSEIAELAKRIESGKVADYEPGEKAFESARVMLARGDYYMAEEKLKLIMDYYPFAPSVREARRILGEMNIDRILSDPMAGGKFSYTTQRGDSFLKIARQHNTTLDCMMALNGLTRLDKLHVNEEFLLMPLNFTLVVDVKEKRLTLQKGDEFVKDYPFKKMILPEAKGEIATSIQGVEAKMPSGKLVKLPSDGYRNAKKVVVIKKPVLELVDSSHKINEVFQGIILSKQDVEELALLMRRGNVVKIKY